MKAVGYSYLNQYYELLLPKLGVEAYQANASEKTGLIDYGATKRKVIPNTVKIDDSPYAHMHAAIKYQGIRLHFFAAIFKKVNTDELASFIKAKPHSTYNRVIWHLYEWLTGEHLPIDDLKAGNYIKLFDDKYYYTVAEGDKDKRTRVINNAIGTHKFCPTIRKTPEVLALEDINVYETAYMTMQQIGDNLSVDVLGRSINYLYTKETKSSNEIEKEKPDKKKMQRFLNTVKNAGLFELTKEKLIDIQNQIVEESDKTNDYRTTEIYVGTTIRRLGRTDEDIHYIGALAKHVPSLMQGLLETHHKLMIDGNIPALMHATAISFGEVYIHPLNDGNGRTHRYLIHDVMKQREPQHNFIIPISAAILKHGKEYDKVLETISRPIMAMVEHELDENNQNTLLVHNDIDYMYRFPDYTDHVVFVYKMMDFAITQDLKEEIYLMLTFDHIKKTINSMVDIPNNMLDKLVSILINNRGAASNAKKPLFYKFLDDEQLTIIEDNAQSFLQAIYDSTGINIVEVLKNENS